MILEGNWGMIGFGVIVLVLCFFFLNKVYVEFFFVRGGLLGMKL